MTERRPKPPRKIRLRLADVPRHLRALAHAVDAFADEDDFAVAARSHDPDVLARVYAVERPFELLANYAVELARLGVVAGGLRDGETDATAKATFLLMRDHGVIGSALCERLIDVHDLRNELEHEYPDVRARRVYRAAREVESVVRDYFRRYLTWLDALGFDVPKV